MSLVATDKGGAEFAITPESTYIGRCFKVIDVGTQTTTGMFGTKEQHKVMISWELFGEDENGNPIVMEDGRPYSASQWYTVSLHEKSKLRADLEAWRGKKFTEEELAGFDLANVLNQYCMIQIVHDDTSKYANVNSIMAFRGTKPKPVNDAVVFDIDNPDMEVFKAMSENMQKKIASAPEWKGAAPEVQPSSEIEDVVITDIPDKSEDINLDDIPF